jgi:hypothetical protein
MVLGRDDLPNLGEQPRWALGALLRLVRSGAAEHLDSPAARTALAIVTVAAGCAVIYRLVVLTFWNAWSAAAVTALQEGQRKRLMWARGRFNVCGLLLPVAGVVAFHCAWGQERWPGPVLAHRVDPLWRSGRCSAASR